MADVGAVHKLKSVLTNLLSRISLKPKRLKTFRPLLSSPCSYRTGRVGDLASFCWCQARSRLPVGIFGHRWVDSPSPKWCELTHLSKVRFRAYLGRVALDVPSVACAGYALVGR